MKYEILKGSEKDFEGAPEWATLRTFTGGCYFFAEYDGGGAKVLDIARNDEFKSTTPFDPSGISIIAERRPITEPDVIQQVTTEWSGEGLPPVGSVCEFQLALGNWAAIRITAHGEDSMLMKQIGKDNEQYISKDNNFRPIRSPEDVARHNALYALESLNIDSDVTVSIYDAIAAGKIPGVKLE